jgi:hypothetical protein
MIANEIKDQFLSHIDNEILIAKDTYAYASNISDNKTYGVGYELGFLDALQSIKSHLESIVTKTQHVNNLEDKKEVPLYSKQMWDSEEGSWVPFDLWGANYIVNHRKEYLALRIYRPAIIQPEVGPIIKGWQSLDSSYLNDQLKEDRDDQLYLQKYKSFAGYQNFIEMIRQDREELNNPF